MKYRNTILLLVIIVLIIVLGIIALLQFSPKIHSVTPHNNEKELWRIAYYEGGSFIDYTLSLRGLVDGLVGLGWIEPITIPEFADKDNAQLLWKYLTQNVKSEFVTFPENAFWSANWEDSIRVTNQRSAIEYLNKNTIDLVLALGTWLDRTW